MQRKTSKKSVRTLAILWTIVAAIWTFVAVAWMDDPSEGTGMKVLRFAVMAASLCITMMHWYRYTHYKEDEY